MPTEALFAACFRVFVRDGASHSRYHHSLLRRRLRAARALSPPACSTSWSLRLGAPNTLKTTLCFSPPRAHSVLLVSDDGFGKRVEGPGVTSLQLLFRQCKIRILIFSKYFAATLHSHESLQLSSNMGQQPVVSQLRTVSTRPLLPADSLRSVSLTSSSHLETRWESGSSFRPRIQNDSQLLA